ncbi:hypothetical protein [Pseudoxanthomonas yeongjuensis]|uniref:hypothetical protein n=1 Tax=Pseudoxanthomonas yeongjuensis TaxID=377616 RepID=UPI001390743E|nr:hypothetical protein [Pseudoxanthomonas yeongjuensis]
MNRWLAIATYQCQIDGVPTGSIDVQVRYFRLPSPEDVQAALQGEPPHVYKNHLDQTVSWHLQQTVNIQGVSSVRSGDEVIGFIADIEDFSAWAGRPAA